MKISPKKHPKSILEEGQTSREYNVKQAVPDSKGRACHVKKAGEADKEVAQPDRATWAEVARPCHMCSSGTAVPLGTG